jgi:hypothetical protein
VSLLESVASLLQRTYAMRGHGRLEPFVIGDEGMRRLYRRQDSSRRMHAVEPGDAATLIRETRQGLAACIYFPDTLIERLEQEPPQRGLTASNFDSFATFVEEIDHLLVVRERARRGQSVRLVELELHANVSKYLVLARFLAAGGGALGRDRLNHLAGRLFEDPRLGEHGAVRERYRTAGRWAMQFTRGLALLEPSQTLKALRRFHRDNLARKLRLIDAFGRLPREPISL